jgi:hypothetical protein
VIVSGDGSGWDHPEGSAQYRRMVWVVAVDVNVNVNDHVNDYVNPAEIDE